MPKVIFFLVFHGSLQKIVGKLRDQGNAFVCTYIISIAMEHSLMILAWRKCMSGMAIGCINDLIWLLQIINFIKPGANLEIQHWHKK
jgi:hypothetical protein